MVHIYCWCLQSVTTHFSQCPWLVERTAPLSSQVKQLQLVQAAILWWMQNTCCEFCDNWIAVLLLHKLFSGHETRGKPFSNSSVSKCMLNGSKVSHLWLLVQCSCLLLHYFHRSPQFAHASLEWITHLQESKGMISCIYTVFNMSVSYLSSIWWSKVQHAVNWVKQQVDRHFCRTIIPINTRNEYQYMWWKTMFRRTLPLNPGSLALHCIQGGIPWGWYAASPHSNHSVENVVLAIPSWRSCMHCKLIAIT